MINKERLLNTFLELVQIDSQTRNERQVADYTKSKLSGLGFTVFEDQAGAHFGGNAGNVIAHKTGNVSGAGVLLCAHMDTVTPGCGVVPVIQDGVISSKGETILGGDDKAGIAAILEMAETMVENKLDHGLIQIVFTVAEEGGLRGAKHIDRGLLKPVDAAFFFDSSNLPSQIVVEAPFQLGMKITFKGKAAHAGVAPEEGISAIVMAAEAISQMPLGRIDETTTANIGIISGGKATNIITDLVTIEGEARSLSLEKVTKQKDLMLDACQKAADRFGGSVIFEVEESYAGISLDRESLTVQIASEAVKNLGMTPELTKTGGGSDANVFNGYGIAATNLGVGMSKVHSTEEYLKISDLEITARTALEIVKVALKH